MRRPLLLDLYCGAGGAAVGYHQAFRGLVEIVGVDITPQPDYPFEFVLGDALEYLDLRGRWFTVIHASPPCQASSALTKGTNAATRSGVHTDSIPAARLALSRAGRPWIMENVAGSRVRKDLLLCGSMFGLGVLRHRYFQLHGVTVEQPRHRPHEVRVSGWRHGTYVDGGSPYVQLTGKGGGKATLEQAQRAMGMPWTNDLHAITEAIPPAYTRYIGEAVGHLLGADPIVALR